LRLALAGQAQEVAVHDRGATNLKGCEVSHASVRTDLAKRRLERLIFHQLEILREIGLGRRKRGGAKRKQLPQPHACAPPSLVRKLLVMWQWLRSTVGGTHGASQ
jgi:hypothetical protein